jgi:c-di-GMP-binding flagellar brake protein YcgR
MVGFGGRKFDRFTIGLELEIFAEDTKGNTFNDKALLRDISGGGAKFAVRHTKKYLLGQLLDITIILPGTDDVDGRMRARSKVVRIERFDESGAGSVAVEFNTSLSFERNI